MIGEQKNRDEGYVSVATKVPIAVADLLQLLAKQRGMEVYELLQMLINGFISAAKCTGPLTRETRTLLNMLKLDVAYCKSFNFASHTACTEIAQVILILQQRGHKGFGMKMIDRPYMGEATETLCVDDILERVAEVSMPGLYLMLRRIGIELDSDSLRETLTMLCDDRHQICIDEGEAAELPQYGTFHDYGKEIEFGMRTRRVHHRSPNDQPTLFDEFATEDDLPESFGSETLTANDFE